jgi:hypothetical protein
LALIAANSGTRSLGRVRMRRDVGVVVLEAEHFRIGARRLCHAVDAEAGNAF